MPRRHQRDRIEPEPLSITPADIPKTRRRERNTVRRANEAGRVKYRKAQDAAARRKRVKDTINWDVCLVPGCLARVRVPEWQRDVDEHLPTCDFHAVVIKRQVDTRWRDEEILALRDQLETYKDQQFDAQERALIIRENSRHGQIYFLRANGLIKVGWSSNLEARLKSYGPDVDLLCHYPGSRQDETLMHRQLRPYLAKGREWYEDCKLIADVVAKLVEQHGQPRLSAYWTQPKPPVIKQRRRSA